MSNHHLIELRESSSLSAEDFAKEIGSSPQAYLKMERGEAVARDVHLNAARWALIMLAGVDKEVARQLPQDIKEVIRAAMANL
ncbi:helix-turn-helix transcriptional regulator [Shinella sp. WSJ-2]|uniref:helix-turn-helix domain-containing protein n=1 Tax=Shinella sp. WSJ-2 TaxID=2303749 RepID=UPI001314E66F|nr:helix-turn-helix transcriptional regulator [Shinella sp. WSJ-2]